MVIIRFNIFKNKKFIFIFFFQNLFYFNFFSIYFTLQDILFLSAIYIILLVILNFNQILRL
jgi:hypothetical protein